MGTWHRRPPPPLSGKTKRRTIEKKKTTAIAGSCTRRDLGKALTPGSASQSEDRREDGDLIEEAGGTGNRKLLPTVELRASKACLQSADKTGAALRTHFVCLEITKSNNRSFCRKS